MASDTHDVKAILGADVSGLRDGLKQAKTALAGLKEGSGVFDSLSGSAQKAGSIFKSVLGANLVTGAVTSFFGAIKSGVSGMISDLNGASKTWQTFEGNMASFGKSSAEIAQVKSELQDFAKATIYSASDMASTYSQLAAVGTKNTTELVKGFGYLASASENPQQAMKTLSQQATQMAAKPKVAWQDFRLILEQTPAGVAKIAEAMGMTTDQLIKSVQDGTVETQAFFDAIVKGGQSFKEMATSFKTVDQAIDGLSEGLTNSLQPAFEKANAFGLRVLNSLAGHLDKVDFSGFADGLGKALEGIDIEGLIDKAVNGLSKIGQFFANIGKTGAFQAVGQALVSVKGAFTNLFSVISTGKGDWSSLGITVGNVIKTFANGVKTIADFIAKLNPSTIKSFGGGLLGLVAGFKAFNFLKSFNPFSFFKKGAEEATNGATNSAGRSKSTITQLFNGLSNVIKSLGTSIKTAATGIGQGLKTALSGLAPVIRAFGASLKTAGVANILAFGGAIAIAAVGIGAGIAIISAGFALLATQSKGVSTILKSVGGVITTLGEAISNILKTAIMSLANAFLLVAPVLPTVASAFAMLSPLIIAAGTAVSMIIRSFSGLAPVITALGSAISQIIRAISTGVAQIATAVTPIVHIISTAFVQVVTVVSNAIVQIVQALAPFIPELTAMVQAVAPVLEGIVSAFNNLISQISPVIDSISNLFKTLGQQISSILKSAGSVVESFGSAIRSVLDGVAGIFESMGNAAKNAGMGVKLMAQGVKTLVDLKLGDLVATLAAVATGLTAIAGSGIASAGPGLQAAGVGMQLIATSAQLASVAIQLLPSALTLLTTSLGVLPTQLTAAGNAMTVFATSVKASVSGLLVAGTSVMKFATMLTGLAPVSSVAGSGLAAFNGKASQAGSAMQKLGSSSRQALAQVTALGNGIKSSMTGATAAISNAGKLMSTAVRSAGTQMTVTMQASMNQVKSVVLNGMTASSQAVRNGGTQMTTAIRMTGTQLTTITQSTMSQMKSVIQNGMSSIVASVRTGGTQMVAAWRSVGQQLVSATQNFVNQANNTLKTIGTGVNLHANGSALMAGLKSGIDAGWSQITASVSSMAEWIKKNKGPISYDRRLLVDNGRAIMFGLNRGIGEGWENVKGNVSSMAVGLSKLLQAEMGNSFDIPNMATSLMNSVSVSHSPQSVQHNIDNAVSQQRMINKFDELIEEVRKNGNTYLDGNIISRKVDRTLGQNTQLRSRTSWA